MAQNYRFEIHGVFKNAALDSIPKQDMSKGNYCLDSISYSDTFASTDLELFDLNKNLSRRCKPENNKHNIEPHEIELTTILSGEPNLVIALNAIKKKLRNENIELILFDSKQKTLFSIIIFPPRIIYNINENYFYIRNEYSISDFVWSLDTSCTVYMGLKDGFDSYVSADGTISVKFKCSNLGEFCNLSIVFKKEN